MFDETLDVYPHEEIFKERQQSMLDQQLTSVRNIGIHLKQIHKYEFI
jgi:hypothetical protein